MFSCTGMSAAPVSLDCAPKVSLPSTSGSIEVIRSRRRPSPGLSPRLARSKSCRRGCARSAAILLRLEADGAKLRLRSQLPLEDLAGRVARQLLHEHHIARNLETGEVRLHVVLHRLLRQPVAVARHYERLQPLPELRALDAPNRALLDLLVRGQRALDLTREQVLPAADDHFIVAPV